MYSFKKKFDNEAVYSLRSDFEGYNGDKLRQDMIAGITVALFTVPQAMAYALLAHLPLSCGLLAAIFSAFFAALFGSSRHLIAGPSNALSLLVLVAVKQVLYTHFRDLVGIEKEQMALQILAQLCLMVAGMQLVAASLGMGRLTRFISQSVVVGYICGAAIAMVVNQLFLFLGVPKMHTYHPIYAKILYLFQNIPVIHWPTTLVGVLTLFGLILMRKFFPKFPGSVVVFGLMTLFVQGLGLEEYGVLAVGSKQNMAHFPTYLFHPFFDPQLINPLLPFAFAIALLGVIETSSISKMLATETGQKLSINQEILGIGVGNLVSSLFLAMPISGSFSRSVANLSYGAKTRLSGMFAAIFVGIIAFPCSFILEKIPLVCLASLLLMTAVVLMKPKQMALCLKATSSDALVITVTIAACLILSLDIAFYIGIFLSITLYLQKAAQPKLTLHTLDAEGGLCSLKRGDPVFRDQVRVIRVDGELFFGATDLFQKSLTAIADDAEDAKVIILHFKNARDIDATACVAIEQLHKYVTTSGRQLLVMGITLPVWHVLSNSGLIRLIGKENVFVYDISNVKEYKQLTLKRTRELLAVKPSPSQEAVVCGDALSFQS